MKWPLHIIRTGNYISLPTFLCHVIIEGNHLLNKLACLQDHAVTGIKKVILNLFISLASSRQIKKDQKMK